MSLVFKRWTLLVLRDCIFLSSLDVFLRLFVSSSTLVGEDLFCAPREYIEADYLARARAEDITLPGPGSQRLAASGSGSGGGSQWLAASGRAHELRLGNASVPLAQA